MSIWGKIVGGAAGLAIGGPIGMLIGAVGGHFVDRYYGERDEQEADPERARKSIGFTIAVIVLGAKMAKADGHVTQDEIRAFKDVFKVPQDEMDNVARVFNQARKDARGFEPYARQVAGMFKGAPEVLEELLWCLAYIAKADQKLHPQELEFLKQVADIFGFDDARFERVTQLRLDGDMADPYQTLGVSKEASAEEIKRAHRRLVVENHPDKMIAKGMPEEFVAVANEKLAAINAAYERIRKERGL
ncbi:TerB family tellurite resistance protein [Marivibrio halodurans]|uniref:TerB family tellurite resistance protein n=1 Tax=Marivibrio halodurans TaxID=2039722 RepID=A0A8J7S2P6_9PROT|nr:TerB family tellurite resistance protein [Marivibrio halodurans]MBP5857549.1 TerB family tellurite resistance protein [Marivibrio halodurans]